MKLVGISGAQGAGKSTMLKELMTRGWQLDQFRVSRAVQAELGWESLDRVMDDPFTMMAFQEEVYRQKLRNDAVVGHQTMDGNPTICLTERTFADIDAYTSQWAWRFVDSGRMTREEAFEFLTEFHSRCVAAQERTYAGIILLPFMDHVVWEEDPNRAARADVERIYEHIERFMDSIQFLSKPKLVVTGKTVEERADQVEAFLRKLNFGMEAK